jgi:hypothetical protein
MDATASRETIIIVHGTWASPAPGVTQWYQPSDKLETFTAKLDQALSDRGSSAKCWAHCPEFEIFKWSGKNNWVDRIRASSELKAYVDDVQSKGWRCHIIAHSHGGNIVIDAFTDRLNGHAPSKMQGKIVTLGTPFLDSMASIKERNEKIRTYVKTIPWVIIGLFLILIQYYLFNKQLHHYLSHSITGILIISCITSLMLYIVWRILGRDDQKKGESRSIRQRKALLSIGSLKDEAWEVLHHLSTMSNPLLIKTGIWSYITDSFKTMKIDNSKLASVYDQFEWRDATAKDKSLLILLYSIDVIRLAAIIALLWTIDYASWYNFSADQEFNVVVFSIFLLLPFAILALRGDRFTSAYLSPYRFGLRIFLFAVITIPLLLANYYLLRPKAWLLLQKTAMGLDGYRFGLPNVEQTPSYISEGCILQYKNLPADVETHALKQRSAWITRHLGDITDTFAKLTLTAADLTALLREIALDQSLVHGAYYTDDECIAQIADWISNCEEGGAPGQSAVPDVELLPTN